LCGGCDLGNMEMVDLETRTSHANNTVCGDCSFYIAYLRYTYALRIVRTTDVHEIL